MAVIGTWIYILGSSSVQSSFDTIVSVDGLLFALFYACTGITMVVYFRRMAAAGLRNAVRMLVIPFICTAFLLYVVWKSIPGLGGWGSGNLISLYVLLGIGALIMIYVRGTRKPPYFTTAREVFLLEDARLRPRPGAHRP
jgi:amino acid transporter